MKTALRLCIPLIIFAQTASTPLLRADDWPHWRGPTYNGVSAESGFKKAWDAKPKKLWQQKIGSAFSGISVVGDRLYTCGIDNEKQALFCLDTADGRIVWKSEIEDNYKSEWGDGARATPTVAGEQVFIMGANGTVGCFKAADGSKVWSRSFENRPMWGYSSSVLVAGDLAIVVTGGKSGAIKALERDSGREVWHCGDDDSPGYSSPYPFTFNGKNYVCGFLGKMAIVADIKTGREVLRIPWKTDWNVNAATPIYHDGHLWLGSGYHTGCGLFKLSEEGDRLAAKEVWKSKVMLNKFQTPVLCDGKLIGFDEKSLSCVDFMTGERHWRERGANGTVLLADRTIIALSEDGLLRVAPPSTSEFKPSGEAQILKGRCWTVPTLSGGRLFARNLNRIVCYDLSK